MPPDTLTPIAAAERARAWRRRRLAAVCDEITPWEYGTVARASRFPTYYEYNLVRVERPLKIGVDELLRFTDEALAGSGHRRIDVDTRDVAEPLVEPLRARGWRTMRVVVMRHEQPPRPGPSTAVREVRHADLLDLHRAWHEEDFPGVDATEFYGYATAVAEQFGVQVLASVERGVPVGYAALEHGGVHTDGDLEITEVYVRADRRGGGLGTALTRAAIAAGAGARDLWISADDDDRPKQLYARLGFRPVFFTTQFLLLG